MYDFWDYLPGALVFGAFLLPITALLVFKVWISVSIWMGAVSGGGYRVSDRGFTTVRFNAHDNDEDR